MCNRRAAQGGEMRAASQCRANVFTECAYVRAFAATHADVHVHAIKTMQLQFSYYDVAQLAFYGDPLAYVFVQRFALMFERAIHGGQLLQRPVKSFEYGL